MQHCAGFISVEWLCRNKTCTVLHQVGVSFDLNLLVRKQQETNALYYSLFFYSCVGVTLSPSVLQPLMGLLHQPPHNKWKNVEHFVHNKPLMNRRAIKPWPPWLKPATNHLSHVTTPILRTVCIILQLRLLSTLQLISHSLRQQWKFHLVLCSTEFSSLHEIQAHLLIFYESRHAQYMMYDHSVPFCIYLPRISQSCHEWLGF